MQCWWSRSRKFSSCRENGSAGGQDIPHIFILFTTPGTIVLHISFTVEFPGDFFNKVKTVSLCLPNSASGSEHRFWFSVFHCPIWFSVFWEQLFSHFFSWIWAKCGGRVVIGNQETWILVWAQMLRSKATLRRPEICYAPFLYLWIYRVGLNKIYKDCFQLSIFTVLFNKSEFLQIQICLSLIHVTQENVE